MKKHLLATVLLSAVMAINAAAWAAPANSPTASPKASAKTTASPEASAKPKSSAKPSASPKTSEKPKSSSKPSASPKTSEKPSSSAEPTASPEPAAKKAEFPVPRADAAIVMDANSGDVIYALNADNRMYPAGLSNIMTAIIALENANLADSCTVTEEALSGITYNQPQLGVKVGESYTVEELLHAIILNSCNDAANVLAISVSGSIDAFVQKMNDKAAELGLTGTHFANANGYQDENHYTTASDMAYLSAYAMNNTTFAKIAATQKYVFPPTQARSKQKTILSTNHLVSRYKYPYYYYANATGIKSGNSSDAGYCLAASAVKGKLNVISVVMGCKNTSAKEGAYSFIDTASIFDYVFENYQSVLLSKKGDVLYDTKVAEAKNSTRLALTVEDDVYITLKNTADPEIITNEVKLVQEAKAPVAQGDYFGTITYSYNGKALKTVNLVAANEVKRDFFLHIINSIIHFIFNPIVLIIVILLVAVWARMRIIRNRKRRKRHSKMVSYSGKTGVKSDRGSVSRSRDYYRRRR